MKSVEKVPESKLSLKKSADKQSFKEDSKKTFPQKIVSGLKHKIPERKIDYRIILGLVLIVIAITLTGLILRSFKQPAEISTVPSKPAPKILLAKDEHPIDLTIQNNKYYFLTTKGLYSFDPATESFLGYCLIGTIIDGSKIVFESDKKLLVHSIILNPRLEANFDNRIDIIDLSNPDLPVKSGHILLDSTKQSLNVYIYKDANLSYVYQPVGEKGIHLIDISDLNLPIDQGYFKLNGSVKQIIGRDNHYLYVITYFNQKYYFNILDIVNPAKPALVKTVQIANTPTLSQAVKSRIYQMDYITKETKEGLGWIDYLTIYDISKPTSLVKLGKLKGEFLRRYAFETSATMKVKEDYVYLVDVEKGLQIFDVSDTKLPQEVGKYKPKFKLKSPNFYIQENQVYLILSADKVRILDVSNPTDIKMIKDINLPHIY